MEPQLEGCGKLRGCSTTCGTCALQWSRNLRVAESAVLHESDESVPLLQWSRNLRVAESRAFSSQVSYCPRFNGAAT